MTTKEYLEIYKKYPNPNDNSKYHTHYEGEKEDYNKLIEFNKKLIERYPFLLPRNRWTGKEVEDFDYSYTELDSMSEGWRIAFGDDMVEEIRNALLDAQKNNPNGGYPEDCFDIDGDENKMIPYLEGYRIMEIKSKYGGLRWYDNGATEAVHNIIHKYEILSESICEICGQPADYISRGWITPFCSECAHKQFEKEENYAKEHYEKYTPRKFEMTFDAVNEMDEEKET